MRNIVEIGYRWILLSIVFACLLLQSCNKTENVEPEKPEPVEPIDRTILIYMAADNNLDYESNDFAQQNIKSMLQGMEGVDDSCRVIIYYDPFDSVPSLLTIEKDGDKCILKTIEEYDEENSSSPEVLSRVAMRVQELYPADSHGLFLWSHATGWLPKNASFPNSRVQSRRMGNLPLTKTWGHDDHLGDKKSGSTEMEILELASALPDGYQFILFDCCFMSTIEVLYELRHKADYIIASPVEILGAGFPYEKIMPFLWGGEKELKQVCEEYYNYYESHPSGGLMQSGVITLTKTEYLDELADYVSRILKGKESEASNLPINAVYRYPMANFTQNVFFDLEDYIQKFANKEQIETFNDILDNSIYKLSTTKYWGKPYPKDMYCGISTYIPLKDWQNMNDEYFELSWSKLMYGE